MHREIARRYRVYYAQRSFRVSTVFSIILFCGSIAANYYASLYATQVASNPVTDIILSNTPAFDVDFFFIYGALALIIFIVILLVIHPKRIPFALHSLALFFFIRAIFISLTHIGPFPTHTPINVTSDIGLFLSKLFFGDDLFFSGHTGAPFLMALMFWQNKTLRYIFLGWSIFLGAVVLLGHIHYSIDVLSAFFITYGIYHIALWLFPRDRALFLSEQ